MKKLLILIVLAALGAGAYVIMQKMKEEQTAP